MYPKLICFYGKYIFSRHNNSIIHYLFIFQYVLALSVLTLIQITAVVLFSADRTIVGIQNVNFTAVAYTNLSRERAEKRKLLNWNI